MKPKITAKKYMGDDRASWAIFVDGKPVLTGLERSEVPYYRQEVERKLKEKSK